MRRIVRDLMTESIDVEVSGCELRAPLVYAVRVHLHLRTHAILYQSPSSGPLTEVLVRSEINSQTGKEYVPTITPTNTNLALRKALSDFCTESLGSQAGAHLAKEVWTVLWRVVKDEVEEFILMNEPGRAEAEGVWEAKCPRPGTSPFHARACDNFFEFLYQEESLAELDPEEVDTLIEALTKFRDKHARKDSSS